MKKIPLLTIIALVACSLGAKAQILEIDNRALFLADTTGATNVDFESVPNTANAGTTGFYTEYSSGLTVSPVTVTPDATFTLYAVSGTAFGPGDGSQYLVSTGGLTLALSPGSTATGFDDFTIGSTTTVSGTVTDSLGNTLNFTDLQPTATGAESLGFIGFLDTAGASISSISLSGGAVDNVVSGSAIAAPEPTTWVLMVAGLGILVLMRRFRARA